MTRDIKKLTAAHALLWNNPARAERLVTFAFHTVPEAGWRGAFSDKRNILFHFDDPAGADKCRRLYDGLKRI